MDMGGSPHIPVSRTAQRALARRFHYTRLLSSGYKGTARIGERLPHGYLESASVGDPRLPRQIAEFSSLEHVHFRVVHFNNGMHGWDYTETQYDAGFPSFLRAVEHIPGHPALMWATTTPVQADQSAGPSNSRIDARNRIAESFIRATGIAVDGQHTLMATHQDLHEDNMHYKEHGAELMGEQAARMIKEALTHPSETDGPKAPGSTR